MIDLMMYIGLIMAIAEILKKSGLNSKYLPLFNLCFGLLLGLSSSFSVNGMITGLMLGASACGVFDFASKTFIKGDD